MRILECLQRPTDYNGRVLPDSALTYSTWRETGNTHSVLGVKVHDAWLVAAMKTHGIHRIVSFNIGDFVRYDGIKCSITHSL